jgi:uncharacterized membrane protein (DUF485 family)
MTAAAKVRPEDVTGQSPQALLASPEFKALVRRRWIVSFSLLTVLFVGYYGYILVVALAKGWVASPISSQPGAVVTVGIPLGVGVIVLAWVLTAGYVWWANAAYDPEVERLKRLLRR